MRLGRLTVLLGVCLLGCAGEPAPEQVAVQDDPPEQVAVEADRFERPPIVVPEEEGPVAAVSVAEMDRPSSELVTLDATWPVEARMLVMSADGREPELDAIRSVLDHRGVPYDVFVATREPDLTASRLRSGERGFYQAVILTSSSLAVGGTSALDAGEWAALADYELAFGVRRAVLAAFADPDLGFGPATLVTTGASPVTIDCTAAGATVFRDVNCDVEQEIKGGTAYLSRPTSGAPLTPLLSDAAGNALAAIHTGSDGRQSLLLLFRNNAVRLHSHQFLHGVLGWVSGGTYLGERRIDMGVQVDDLFFASEIWTGGTYRLTRGDLLDALAWLDRRRAQAATPDFRVSLAFNGAGAGDSDGLTAEAIAQNGEWNFVNHTWSHAGLDDISYADARLQFDRNIQLAADLPLDPFDERDLVTGNVSGLVNPDAMQAAWDSGVRFVVSDTSAEGCDNPSPNTTFYNEIEPGILLVPRRPGGVPYDVSTPSQWVARSNSGGDNTTYNKLLEQLTATRLLDLMRGDADPWMYHQNNLRAYDGVHSILGDLVDRVVTRFAARLRVPVRTLSMEETALRFARRINADTAGVRATLYRGRALLIDAARPVSLPVTGVRAADGEDYGGDVIGLVTVSPGTTTCVPLDSAGQGCSPPPVREGGPGPATALPTGICDASSLPHTPPIETAIARGSVWRYRDRGGLGGAWRGPTYDDSAWASGPGPLGYGEPYIATTVSYGSDPDNRHITTYFRRTFTLTDPAAVSALRGELMYDDGIVVYLNGSEIGRAAMPGGTISSTTLASGHEANNSYETFDWTASRGLLVAGTNTIAVEVHQSSPTSSDLVFDLALLLDGS